MNITKRIACLAVCAAMMLSFVSCGDKDSSSSKAQANDSSAVSESVVDTDEEAEEYKVTYDDYSATVQAIKELSDWDKSTYTRNSKDAVCAYGYAPLFYCAFNVYPQDKAADLIEKHKGKGYKTGTFTYDGKMVSYSIGYLDRGSKLIERITIHLPVGDGYVRELGIQAGGLVYHNAEHSKDEEIADWVNQNKDKYKDLSDDPQSYVYLFKAFK